MQPPLSPGATSQRDKSALASHLSARTWKHLDPFFPCSVVVWSQMHQEFSGWSDCGLRAVSVQPETRHFRQLTLAEGRGSKVTWVLPSQMSVYGRAVSTPQVMAHIFSLVIHRGWWIFFPLPCKSRDCHSLFVLGISRVHRVGKYVCPEKSSLETPTYCWSHRAPAAFPLLCCSGKVKGSCPPPSPVKVAVAFSYYTVINSDSVSFRKDMQRMLTAWLLPFRDLP